MPRLSRAALFLIVCAPAALAQARASPAIADSTPAKIMARVGKKPGAVWLRDILRQANAQFPSAKLDQIADSLALRAIVPAGVQPRSEVYANAVDALNALVLAGSSAPLGGRPYAGAFDRMVTVHRQAQSQNIRARALSGMVATSHSRAVAYLREVAESTDATAYDAVEALVNDANGGSRVGIEPSATERQESASALNAMASSGRVKDQRAVSLLGPSTQR